MRERVRERVRERGREKERGGGRDDYNKEHQLPLLPAIIQALI